MRALEPLAAVVMGVVALAGCEKMPVVQVDAGFQRAEASYFAGEQTLFVFYRFEADQGLGDASQMELRYRTDRETVGWTALKDLPMVHTHVPVDCGANVRCGSASVKVELPPLEVSLRLRYHRDGLMALDVTPPVYFVADGPAPGSRSLLVYGVMDQSNRRVQWRARHTFPNLRNEEAQAFGLRRWFRVDHRAYGAVTNDDQNNPYGYAFAIGCPPTLTPLDGGALETTDRAAFDEAELPVEAADAPVVCARSSVTDALGGLVAPALARKNPEVRPAFPALKTPIRRDTPVGFLLAPCTRTISDAHRAMQLQRLLLTQPEVVCIDDWAASDFASTLATRFQSRIDAARTAGDDMVLTIALHHDDETGGLASVLESVLVQVLSPERDKSSPRVSGAFVFDSVAHAISTDALKPLALWCPADTRLTLDEVPSTSAHACPLLPEVPDIVLGPLRFNNLPILPTRSQYLTFIGRYGEPQAGHVTDLTFVAPERTPVSENITIGSYGVATFFNDEHLSAASTDAFSYCAPSGNVVFRVPALDAPLPLQMLPDVQAQAPQPQYELGLAWDFPYLARMRYETLLAGQLSAFSFSVPFGIKGEGDAAYGSALWDQGTFPLEKALWQCTRFCRHPTFDTSGVYDPLRLFDPVFTHICYAPPKFPQLGEGGFPLD